MLISTSHKFCFTHIPRTGGASIKAALNPYSDRFNGGVRLPVHAAMNEPKARGMEDFFKFTIVRNPWARYASLYRFQQGRGEIPGVSFEQYLHQLVRYRLKYRFYAMHQEEFGLKHMNFIGRYETLQTSFDWICHEIGLPRIELPHEHDSGDYNYTEMYSREGERLVKSHCQDELKSFGYKFGE